MQDFFTLLDNIVLSTNAVDDFYSAYENNINFHNWIDGLIPEIKKCEEQEQNTPWHKYNVLRHILHSVEEMNKQTIHLDHKTRRMLAYTMFFHDIGKPSTHIFREKNGKMVDSFFGHNIKSCEIIKPILPQLGFNAEECKIILKLVHKHDIFMFIKPFPTNNPHWRTLSPMVIKQEIEDLNSVGDGKTLLKYLVMIGKSDNRAQNEKMTGNSLQMLEKFDKMLNSDK